MACGQVAFVEKTECAFEAVGVLVDFASVEGTTKQTEIEQNL